MVLVSEAYLDLNEAFTSELLLNVTRDCALLAFLKGANKPRPMTFTMFTDELENQEAIKKNTPHSSQSVEPVTMTWSDISSRSSVKLRYFKKPTTTL